MKKASWKLGDPCFIADTDSMRMRVMPATIIRLSGLPVPSAQAMALNPERLAGAISEEGEPFLTERAARACARAVLAKRTSWLSAQLTTIPVEGRRPAFEVPAGLPNIGQVVYVLDTDACEVLEVTVGWTGLDFSTWQAGYDSSPGNPEANMVRIAKWWPSKEQALWGARNRHYKEFVFVSKKKLANRVNAQINKVWDDALERLRDPERNRRHNDAVKRFFDGLRTRGTVAAE